MNLDYKIIGKRIKEIRLQKLLTQEKLAEMCNLSVSSISRIEVANRNVSLDTLINIGNSLGVTVDTFLKGYQKSYNTDIWGLFKDCSCYVVGILLDLFRLQCIK